MFKKVVLGILIGSFACFFMTSCGRENPPSVQSSDSKDVQPKLNKVTVLLDWTPNTNHTGLYVAKEKDFYKEAGLDVDIIQPSEGSGPELVSAGKATFALSYQEQITFARTAEHPLKVKAVAAIIQHNTSGFASPVEKNIKSPKDFENKTYGGWGSEVERATLKALMKDSGGDYSKVKLVDIGASDFFSSIKKEVDFSWIFYGWDGIFAENKNIKLNFIKLRDLNPMLDYYTPVLIAGENTLQSNPELVRKFTMATKKGYEFAIQNAKESAGILVKNAPEIDAVLAEKSQVYLAKEYQSDAASWGEMKLSVWENYGNWLFENQLMSTKFDAKEAFTNEFLK